MKKINASIVLLGAIFVSSASFASVCQVTGSNGGYWQNGKSHVLITCDKGNPDARTILGDGDPDALLGQILTAVNGLMSKGYKVISQADSITYTLAK